MYRRGYLALASGGLAAGCTGQGESAEGRTESGRSRGKETATSRREEAATPTEARAETAAIPETDTEPETEPGTPTVEQRVATELAAARTALRRGYQAYLGYADGTAGRLLDVGLTTTGFNADRVEANCTVAGEHLTTATEMGTVRQQQTAHRLRAVGTWLSGAAAVHGQLSVVTEGLNQAAKAAQGPRLGAVESALTATRHGTETVRSTVADLPDPNVSAFDATAFVDGRDVRGADDRFRRWARRFEPLAGHVEETVDAVEGLREAREYDEEGNTTLARAAAEDAESRLASTTTRLGTGESDPIEPLVAIVRSVVRALRERAAGIGARVARSSQRP